MEVDQGATSEETSEDAGSASGDERSLLRGFLPPTAGEGDLPEAAAESEDSEPESEEQGRKIGEDHSPSDEPGIEETGEVAGGDRLSENQVTNAGAPPAQPPRYYTATAGTWLDDPALDEGVQEIGRASDALEATPEWGNEVVSNSISSAFVFIGEATGIENAGSSV